VPPGVAIDIGVGGFMGEILFSLAIATVMLLVVVDVKDPLLLLLLSIILFFAGEEPVAW